MTDKKKVALLGTMDTNWRADIAKRLRDCYQILDNTDPRWETAKTAEEKEPLIEKDIAIMHDADVVIWHHDEHALGFTARIELGYLAALADQHGVQSIVHVDPDVISREYMRALVMHHPNMRWAESWDEVLRFIGD